MEAFNNSIGFDKRLWQADITGSIAYAKALGRSGILKPAEVTSLVDGLSRVAEEWRAGSFKIVSGDEDIHTANERRLGELIGPVAGKLHTGRRYAPTHHLPRLRMRTLCHEFMCECGLQSQ
jgi:argininosuccinate lyase